MSLPDNNPPPKYEDIDNSSFDHPHPLEHSAPHDLNVIYKTYMEHKEFYAKQKAIIKNVAAKNEQLWSSDIDEIFFEFDVLGIRTRLLDLEESLSSCMDKQFIKELMVMRHLFTALQSEAEALRIQITQYQQSQQAKLEVARKRHRVKDKMKRLVNVWYNDTFQKFVPEPQDDFGTITDDCDFVQKIFIENFLDYFMNLSSQDFTLTSNMSKFLEEQLKQVVQKRWLSWRKTSFFDEDLEGLYEEYVKNSDISRLYFRYPWHDIRKEIQGELLPYYEPIYMKKAENYFDTSSKIQGKKKPLTLMKKKYMDLVKEDFDKQSFGYFHLHLNEVTAVEERCVMM